MDEADLKDIIALIRSPVTTELIAYVSEQAAFVISCNQSSNCSTTRTTEEKYSVLPSLPAFIEHLVKRSASKAGTLLGSLVFLNKLQERLYNIAKGMPCTSHRIFLATLIVTTKSLHDTSPKNKHWAKYASYFNLPEINLMEKQLLTLMVIFIYLSFDDLFEVLRLNLFYRTTIS
jgi:hypothetical protein